MENAKKFFEEVAKTEEAKALFAAIETPKDDEELVAAYIEIAKKLHISHEHFSRIFKHETGSSPKRYLNDIRMKKAAEYLTKEDSSVTRTAKNVGFPDVLSFSRAFKAYYGCTPTEYKRRNENSKN